MARYPLSFGMAGIAWWLGGEGPPKISDYRVESDREYTVRVGEKSETGDPWGGTSREAGVAKVGGTPGAFWVEFDADATGKPTPRFYSVWRVDRGGVANLNEILMATGPEG
jgi:hypothetical protein